MTWWPGALVVAFGLVMLGWRAHRWSCMRRNGCPEWLEERAKDWDVKATLNGWHRRRKKSGGGEAKTTGDPWQHWVPSPPLDEEPKTGVPLQIEPTPTTGVANPRRKVP